VSYAAIHIPIKTTNERLPGKNTRPLAGRPLYEYLFSTLRHLPDVPVFIDSSDPAILAAAAKWNFHPLERPRALDGNSVTGNELLARALPLMTADVIGQLHVTSPFVRRATIMRAFGLLRDEPEIDAVFGARPLYNRFWFAGRPVNHDPDRLQRTQELEPVYEESDFYFFRKETFLHHGRRVAGRIRMIDVDPVEAVDIDTLQDFLHAEALIHAGVAQLS
jgi:CMP-N-acetylneuraminic acid synthetase